MADGTRSQDMKKLEENDSWSQILQKLEENLRSMTKSMFAELHKKQEQAINDLFGEQKNSINEELEVQIPNLNLMNFNSDLNEIVNPHSPSICKLNPTINPNSYDLETEDEIVNPVIFSPPNPNLTVNPNSSTIRTSNGEQRIVVNGGQGDLHKQFPSESQKLKFPFGRIVKGQWKAIIQDWNLISIPPVYDTGQIASHIDEQLVNLGFPLQFDIVDITTLIVMNSKCKYVENGINYVLTDSGIMCFRIPFQPDLLMCKLWSHEMVGYDGNSSIKRVMEVSKLGFIKELLEKNPLFVFDVEGRGGHDIDCTDGNVSIKKNLASQKCVCSLDMQVNNQGEAITALVAILCKDRDSSSSYTHYLLLTLHYESGFNISRDIHEGADNGGWLMYTTASVGEVIKKLEGIGKEQNQNGGESSHLRQEMMNKVVHVAIRVLLQLIKLNKAPADAETTIALNSQWKIGFISQLTREIKRALEDESRRSTVDMTKHLDTLESETSKKIISKECWKKNVIHNGFSTVGTFTDSPCIKLRIIFKVARSGNMKASVQPYEGGLGHTWVIYVFGGELIATFSAANYYKSEHLKGSENWALVEKVKYFYIAGISLTIFSVTNQLVAEHVVANDKVFTINLYAPFVCEFFKNNFNEIELENSIYFGNSLNRSTAKNNFKCCVLEIMFDVLKERGILRRFIGVWILVKLQPYSVKLLLSSEFQVVLSSGEQIWGAVYEVNSAIQVVLSSGQMWEATCRFKLLLSSPILAVFQIIHWSGRPPENPLENSPSTLTNSFQF